MSVNCTFVATRVPWLSRVFHGYRARGHYMRVPRVAIPRVNIFHAWHTINYTKRVCSMPRENDVICFHTAALAQNQAVNKGL